MHRPPRPAHFLLVSPPLHCTGGNGMSLLQCQSRSVPAIFRGGLSMCIRYLASRLCLPKHVRRGGTGSRYLRGLGIGSASGCQWFQTSVHAISLPLNRHPWLCAWLLRPSLRCRRFVQLLPRRGALWWTSLLLKLGGSFREVSRQTRWPNTIGRALRPMKPLRELFKPCFGHLRVSRHLRRAQGSLMLTSTVMESISRCSYALHVARQASCRTGWTIRKTPILCQYCCLQLSPIVLGQSAGCSVSAQALGICMPGVCAFGLLPQSAPSGSRLLFASIYSQELHVTPEQGPSRRLWLSRWALRNWPHSWALTMQLHAYMGGAARFMSPSRAVRRSCHLLHSASAHFGIITFTLPGMPGTRHHPWKHTQPCQILLRYPGADYLQLPRPSP